MARWGPVYSFARQISRLQRHLTAQLSADSGLDFVPTLLCVDLMLTAHGNWQRALSFAQRTAAGACSAALLEVLCMQPHA